MPDKESGYPPDWKKIAEKDLTRVEKLLDIQDPEMAGFCLQQAVEKFFKAYLLSKGWKLRRIHDLETLLNYALGYDSSLDYFYTVCQRITDFYMIERYPLFTASGITEKDVRECLKEAKILIDKLRKEIK